MNIFAPQNYCGEMSTRSPPLQNHKKCIYYYYCCFWCFCSPQQNNTLTRTSSVNTSERLAGRFVYAASADQSVESTHHPTGRQSMKFSPVYLEFRWVASNLLREKSVTSVWAPLACGLCLLLGLKNGRRGRCGGLMAQNRDERITSRMLYMILAW